LLLAWLVVGVPLGWGVYNTLLSSMNLVPGSPGENRCTCPVIRWPKRPITSPGVTKFCFSRRRFFHSERVSNLDLLCNSADMILRTWDGSATEFDTLIDAVVDRTLGKEAT
jgi:hypothetical protein